MDGVIDCSEVDDIFEEISDSPIDTLFSVDIGEPSGLIFCIEVEFGVEFIGSVERYSDGAEGRDVDDGPEGDNDEDPIVEGSEEGDGDGEEGEGDGEDGDGEEGDGEEGDGEDKEKEGDSEDNEGDWESED